MFFASLMAAVGSSPCLEVEREGRGTQLVAICRCHEVQLCVSTFHPCWGFTLLKPNNSTGLCISQGNTGLLRQQSHSQCGSYSIWLITSRQTLERFHECFWKSLGANVCHDSLVIWDNLNPALMLIHPLQCHAVRACDTALN